MSDQPDWQRATRFSEYERQMASGQPEDAADELMARDDTIDALRAALASAEAALTQAAEAMWCCYDDSEPRADCGCRICDGWVAARDAAERAKQARTI
jgi:hypothetical protein